MKKLLLFAIAASAIISAYAEPFILPKTSYAHLENYDLQEGEFSWIDNEGEAVLLIGNGTKQPRTISNDKGLQKQNTYFEIAQSSLSIDKDSYISYADGSYIITNNKSDQSGDNKVTGTFTITAPAGSILGLIDFDYNFIDMSDSIGAKHADFNKTFSENTCILKVTLPAMSQIKIWNFTGKIRTSDQDKVNDTTADGNDYIIKDNGYECKSDVNPKKVGPSTYKLSGLRDWVANLYNNNRGEHWSTYEATKSVQLKGFDLNFSFDRTSFTGFGYNYEQLFAYQSGLSMFYFNSNTNDVVASGDIAADAELRFTKWEQRNTNDGNSYKTFYGEYSYTGISNFNIKNLLCISSPSLDKKDAWYEIELFDKTHTATSDTSGTGSFIVKTWSSDKSSMGFYKLKYEDKESRILQVVFTSDVVIKDKLVLRSPNGTYYTIKVSDDGTLSTEAYTKPVPIMGN